MEVVVHRIRELDSNRRSAAELLVGHPLREDQQLIIQVVDMAAEKSGRESTVDDGQLPAWFNVYEGLTDNEIAELDQAISRRLDLTRKNDFL